MDGSADELFHDPAEQRYYYETLIEASPTAIVTGTPDLIVTSWNPAAVRLFGYTSEEAIGHHIDELVARSDEVRDEAASVNARLFEGPVELVTRRTRKDGTLVDVAIRGVPIMMNGRLVGVFALYEDVGELVRQRRFFESLVETSPTAIMMVDADFAVTLWNPGAERLFGYSSEEAIGAQLDDLVANHPDIHAEAVAWSAEAWEVDSFRRIGRRTRKDGTFVDVEILAVRVLHEGEAILLHHLPRRYGTRTSTSATAGPRR